LHSNNNGGVQNISPIGPKLEVFSYAYLSIFKLDERALVALASAKSASAPFFGAQERERGFLKSASANQRSNSGLAVFTTYEHFQFPIHITSYLIFRFFKFSLPQKRTLTHCSTLMHQLAK
jgi:hypothetical protein